MNLFTHENQNLSFKQKSKSKNQGQIRETESWSPTVVIDTISTGSAKIHVAREDLLPGGTKQRAIIPYLKLLESRGYTEFVYASPFCGFAQIALAVSASALGLKARIFCERNENTAYAKIAEGFGATVTFVDSLDAANVVTRAYASAKSDRYAIPLGFADAPYIEFMTEALEEQYRNLCEQIGHQPKRIWLPVGSGTLARIFAEIVNPFETELLCVNVRVLPDEDRRISGLQEMSNVSLENCEELFCEPALDLPPLPSNLNYDAKLWKHIVKSGQDGDLWWNVAR